MNSQIHLYGQAPLLQAHRSGRTGSTAVLSDPQRCTAKRESLPVCVIDELCLRGAWNPMNTPVWRDILSLSVEPRKGNVHVPSFQGNIPEGYDTTNEGSSLQWFRHLSPADNLDIPMKSGCRLIVHENLH